MMNPRYLEVDLGKNAVRKRHIPPEIVDSYLGGSAMAASVLLDELDPAIPPLAPESPIIIATGLLTGTPVPTACKASICHRSPLTGIWNETTFGGHFPAEMRRAGADGIIIRGRAERPVYLWGHDGEIQICDASHLSGKDTFQTDEMLRGETSRKSRVGAIGIAGENLVPMASVIFEGAHSRAAGRGGAGAAFGSKNLKAIVATGKVGPAVGRTEKLAALLKKDVRWIKENTQGLSRLSTAGAVEIVETLGDLPIKNWLLGTWKEGASRTCAQYFLPRTFESHYGCFSCPIRCGKSVRLKEGRFAGVFGHGPEYETCAGFGAMCLNDDFEYIFAANFLCNRHGLDTISTSSAIAFAMEAFEKGILSRTDTNGLDLAWGRGDAILALVEKIARREDIGEWLADGTRRAAEVLGNGSDAFAVHVKGLEVAYHDPRAFTSMAVNYATANRGGCHLEALSYFLNRGVTLPDMGYTSPPPAHASEGMGRVCFDMQNYMAVFNPLGLCKFLLFAKTSPSHVASWVSAATGGEFDKDRLLATGERIFDLKRNYNARLGIDKKHDTLPPRLLTHPRPDGEAGGVLPNLEVMLPDYYRLRNW